MTAQKDVKTVNKSSTSGNGVINFFKELKAEFKRITWASKENVKKSTATVVTYCIIYVIAVGILDFAFKNLIETMFK